MPITPEISRKLQALKAESCLTFEQIGKKTGTSDANARRYILGETKTPDMELLRAIIETIGGDPDEILSKKPVSIPDTAPQGAQVYEKFLTSMETRHREELAHLRAIHTEALQAKDQWINTIKEDLTEAKKQLAEIDRAHRRLRALLVIFAIALAVCVGLFVLPDLLNGTWGVFRY